MSRPPDRVFTSSASGSGLTEPLSACQHILLQRGSSAATGTDHRRAAPLSHLPQGELAWKKVSFRAEISPLARRAIIVLLGCDCVPAQLKAMTFHGVPGVEKREDLEEKNNVADA